MESLIKKVRNRILREALPAIFRPQGREELTRLGSPYGGWTIPFGRLDSSSVCYSFGAGEDLTFDLELAHRCGCTVHIFDPTPRAKAHFEQLCATAAKGALPPGKEFFVYRPELLAAVTKLVFHPVGIWEENTTLEFYEPADARHVSHSLVNLQGTRAGFEAEVRTLDTIMRDLGHEVVDMMKADIEGAEFEVLNSLIDHRLFPSVLAIEFDAVAHGRLAQARRLRTLIACLKSVGYCLEHIEGWNYLFVRRFAAVGSCKPIIERPES